jgi:hypothetical protein
MARDRMGKGNGAAQRSKAPESVTDKDLHGLEAPELTQRLWARPRTFMDVRFCPYLDEGS